MSEDMSYHDEEEKEDSFLKKNIPKDQLNNTQSSKSSKKQSQKSSKKSKESKENKRESSKKNTSVNNAYFDNSISTETYLTQTVAQVLQDGFLELVRRKPDNPLEFLGNFILDKAKNK